MVAVAELQIFFFHMMSVSPSESQVALFVFLDLPQGRKTLTTTVGDSLSPISTSWIVYRRERSFAT